MLIAHIDTGKELRGGQTQLLLLARGLRTRGHNQLIVCPEDSRLEGEAQQEGFRVFALPAHDPGHVHGTLILRERLQSEHFEILHAHDGRGQTISWVASAGMSVRRMASRRVTFLPEGLSSQLGSHRLKYALTCHGIIAVSEFVRQSIVRAGVPASLIEVVSDGIELPPELPTAEDRGQSRAQWGWGEQEFVIGHAGAFTPEKGQDVALKAAVLLLETLPQARWVLAGDGPVRTSQPIADLSRRLVDRVRVPGHIPDLTSFFAGLDLYVMPSRAEGLGSSALLAMAHGLAVVASRVGGLPEVVDEGETGWLVEPGSPAALAEAVIRAASDPARCDFGLRGRARARLFTNDMKVDRTEMFYRSLLAHEP